MPNNNVSQPTREQQLAVLKRLEKFSRFTDSSIKIPFTNFSIGADAVVGLLPGVGDVIGLGFSGYVLLEAHRAGADGELKLRILRNMGIDFVGGLLPVVGDAFDAFYKANTRNTQLLKEYLEQQLAPEPTPPRFKWLPILGAASALALVIGAVILATGAGSPP
ncbi:DUF4112 domain-containing protein [Litorivivens sp.]|uniref:DUF4112 domain-containing protein n=1 Tax=Litorivivens sp. TaxID=2020868 RepID=UPI003569DD3D